MPHAVTCPKCCRQVSLPAAGQTLGEQTPTWVRCPLCRSEYPLQEALHFAPPALEIVLPPQHVTAPQQNSRGAEVVLSDIDMDSPGLDLRPEAQAPAVASKPAATDQNIPDLLINPEREDFATSQQTSAPPHPAFVSQQAFPADVAFSPATASQITVGENDLGDDFKLSPETPSARVVPMPTRGTGFQTLAPGRNVSGGPMPDQTVPQSNPADEPWNAPPVGGNQAAVFPTVPPKRPRGFRRARRRNPIIELVMIIVGGAAGLVIGYGILLWGFKVDPFDLAKYLPASMLPEKLQTSGSSDASDTSEIAHGNGISIRRTPAPDTSVPPASTEPQPAPTQNGPPPGPATSPGTTTPPNATSASPLPPAAPATHPELPPLSDSTQPPPESLTEAGGPKTDTAYTLDDVSRAITAARQAEDALQKARTDNGNNNDAPAVKEQRTKEYIALAQLADVVTLLRGPNDDRQIARSTAATFVQHLADYHEKLEELGTLAGHWLNASTRASSGIILAGTVQNVQPLGQEYQTNVKLFGHDKLVPVISVAQPGVTADDAVFVLGTIVTNPRQDLPQYTGKDETVVWGAVVEKPTSVASGGAF
jgi:hypothetical protein